jgi:hypothetical protein
MSTNYKRIRIVPLLIRYMIGTNQQSAYEVQIKQLLLNMMGSEGR